MRSQYFAHSANEVGNAENVCEHLTAVANTASDYARPWGGASEAFVAGLLHDIGKYGALFQRRLEGKERGVDHWSPGAWIALVRYQAKGVASALAIQGHHIGLQKADKSSLLEINPDNLRRNHPKELRISEESPDELIARLAEDSVCFPPAGEMPDSVFEGIAAPAAASMLDVRMLFSCLVDADYIETEAHFQGRQDGTKVYRPVGPALRPEDALSALTTYIEQLSAQSTSAPEIRQLRNDLLDACNSAASQNPGLFTCTAPTGAGKTLSLLSYALKHAAAHGLRRVVVVNPYLNIIEQTVDVYKKALKSWITGDDLDFYILEHHSLAGTKNDENSRLSADRDHQTDTARAKRLLMQNWDAPIIITTTVQFFESLFASRPGACRKLHRLAKSVIVLDEAQTLPVSVAVPTLAALSRLAQRYGSTVVFSTATQPAFSHLDDHVKRLAANGWKPKEIVPDRLKFFERAKRTRVRWPKRSDERIAWDRLSSEIAAEQQILCIVNLKRHALGVHRLLREAGVDGLFHLSTNMCPLHRRSVLDSVKHRLSSGEPCRLIATQCVEAGVDLDFPTVYRAWAPLDAVTQAAGRCNRNGKSTFGTVRVFVPEEEEYPDGAYKQAAGITRILAAQAGDEGPDIHSAETFETYYRNLYDVSKPEDQREELTNALTRRNFVDVSEEYHIIDNSAVNVLVPYSPSDWEDLKNEAAVTGLTRAWIKKARPHCVSLFTPKHNDPVRAFLDPLPVGARSTSDEWFVYLEADHYSMETGLVLPEKTECLIA
jgi:CRISPR-associated helicase Cas3/CRISPR-associated endonuclease Cas3-HD